jgi:hypothetical protein
LSNLVHLQGRGKPLRKKQLAFCFIKPEITRPSESINLDAILELILDRIGAFGLTIHSATLLSADYLKDHRCYQATLWGVWTT